MLIQTFVAMGIGLLIVLTLAREAYPRQGWVPRLVGMVEVFGLFAAPDFALVRGAGDPDDFHGVGISLHYLVLPVLLLFVLGVFIAPVRARRRLESPAAGR